MDVFFVLSGYLVTNLLVREISDSGRLSFRRFYSRRVRRLLPAAVVNLVIVAVVFQAIAAPVDFAAAADSIKAAALYVSNWYFIREAANYFGADITASPVAQYWSLSVEEQFYVVWPVVVYGLFRIGNHLPRWRVGTVRAVVAIGGTASLVAALVIARTDLDRAYYGTDTRAYQLLAGAFLALTPVIFDRVGGWRRARPFLPAAGAALILALVIVGTSLVDVGPITRGAVVTLLVVALLVVLEISPSGIARRFLSLPPVVYLGQISYGTYLWHWIVILVATERLSMAPLSTFAVTAAVATGLAALSYELLEHPIRVSEVLARHRGPVITVGLATSVLVAVLVVPNVLGVDAETGRSATALDAHRGGTPNDANWRRAFLDIAKVSGSACDPDDVTSCRIVRGGAGTVLLADDSHAQMMAPMFATMARRRDLSLVLAPLPFCPWTEGVRYAIAGRDCFRDQRDLYDRLIPEVDPDLVILVHRTIDDPNNSLQVDSATRGRIDRPADRAQALRSSITTLVHRLRAQHRTVVLVEPVPVSRARDDPEKCLSSADYLEACRFVSHVGATPEEQVYRDLADADAGVISLDVDRLTCPYLPICDPVVNGMVVRRDDTHLTQTFADSLLTPLTRALVDHGALPVR